MYTNTTSDSSNVFSPSSPALSNSVASVCSQADVSCLDSSYFPPLEPFHRGALTHDEAALGYGASGDAGCLGVLDSALYRSELSQLNVCNSKECERPSKRLRMGLADSFISDTHRITGAKMAVSLTDFSTIASGDANTFISSHSRHHQHTALQSDWSPPPTHTHLSPTCTALPTWLNLSFF